MIKLTVKKIFRNKANIIMISIFAICSLALIGVLTYEKNIISMQRDDFDKNVDGRTLMVAPNEDYLDELGKLENGFSDFEYDFKSIHAIKHVDAAYYTQVESGGETSFKSNEYNGRLTFRYGNEQTIPNKIIGEKFTGDDIGVAICPNKFYPDNSPITKDTKYIKGEDILNKTFDFYYKSYDENRVPTDKIKTFKIIGLYDNTIMKEAYNSCFVSARDLQSIYDETLGIINKESISSINVVVDDIKNLSYVEKELNKLRYRFGPLLVIDTHTVNNLRIITYTCIVFVIIVIVGVSLTFIKKRNVMNSKEIGLLSSLGFSNKRIELIYTLDLFVITAISYLVSILFLLPIYLIVTKVFNNYFLNTMYVPHLYFSGLLVTFIMVIVVPLIINYILTIISLKKSDNYLMKEEE